MNDWWSELLTIEKIYWLFAIPSSLAFLISLVATFFGGDIEGDIGDADMEIESDSGIGFQFFTLKNLISFFAIFSWSGLACIDGGLGTFSTALISTICGLIMMLIMASIFYFMSKLSESGTLVMNNCIGKLGEVYLVIPSNRASFGKVQINVQGSVRELQAMTDESEDLTRGQIVKVIQVVDQHILLVEKSK